jgi:hypothetical protein
MRKVTVEFMREIAVEFMRDVALRGRTVVVVVIARIQVGARCAQVTLSVVESAPCHSVPLYNENARRKL